MTINEIKKALYKEKPKAKLMFITDTDYHYQTTLEDGYGIVFTVPIVDMGETLFKNEEPAQLLIRYIVL
jgi:hypothetical protein